MHQLMVGGPIAAALVLRYLTLPRTLPWPQRWVATVGALTLPPLLLLTTAMAIVLMGPAGQMAGMTVGFGGYGLSVAILTGGGFVFLVLLWLGWRSQQQVQTYPEIQIQNHPARLLKTPLCFAGQVGLWRPQLVVSQGLLDTLNEEQLGAVLAHEQAHAYYGDTFWFLVWGWLRRLTAWLPRTGQLWQELLLLRELRADHWAATQVDPLTLAESLLLVVRSPLPPFPTAVAFNDQPHRLEDRINALLATDQGDGQGAKQERDRWLLWGGLLILLPLLLMPLHQ
ncbi:MAG: M56 family peptidase [Spirulina sp. DLM2.Bin59]|nr:MAG: M56 family peptidase [Spirulina sp. DLM2.Bin59]